MNNEQLVIRIKAGEDVADNMLQLWQQNQGIIAKMAGKYSSMAEEEDLKQEGYLALCDAVEHYKPDEGANFITYAIFWMKQRMIRYGQNNGTVRVSIGAGEKVRAYNKLVSSFIMQIGRKPTEREICRYLGVTGEMLRNIQEAARMTQIDSLDTPIEGTDSLVVGDSVASPEDVESTILDKVQQEQLKAVIWPLVDALPGQQPDVLRARFIDGLTLQATGDKLGGITRERVRQLEYKGMRALRQPGKAKKLAPFLDEVIYSKAIRGGGVGRFNDTWTSSTEYVALGLVE